MTNRGGSWDDLPSDSWVYDFKRRHGIDARMSRGRDQDRAKLTVEQVLRFYMRWEEEVIPKITKALEAGHRVLIFNCDESGICGSSNMGRGETVLVERINRQKCYRTQAADRGHVTLTATGGIELGRGSSNSAVHVRVKTWTSRPMWTMPGTYVTTTFTGSPFDPNNQVTKEQEAELEQNSVTGWHKYHPFGRHRCRVTTPRDKKLFAYRHVVAASKSGFVTNKITLNYMRDFIIPDIRADKGNHKGYTKDDLVIFLQDNHSSHLTEGVLDLLKAENIEPVFLPPHSTHLLQPLDLSCFQTFKKWVGKDLAAWTHHVHFNYGSTSKIRFHDIRHLLCDALRKAMDASQVQKGYRDAGLWPFNPDKALAKMDCSGTYAELKQAWLDAQATTAASSGVDDSISDDEHGAEHVAMMDISDEEGQPLVPATPTNPEKRRSRIAMLTRSDPKHNLDPKVGTETNLRFSSRHVPVMLMDVRCHNWGDSLYHELVDQVLALNQKIKRHLCGSVETVWKKGLRGRRMGKNPDDIFGSEDIEVKRQKMAEEDAKKKEIAAAKEKERKTEKELKSELVTVKKERDKAQAKLKRATNKLTKMEEAMKTLTHKQNQLKQKQKEKIQKLEEEQKAKIQKLKDAYDRKRQRLENRQSLPSKPAKKRSRQAGQQTTQPTPMTPTSTSRVVTTTRGGRTVRPTEKARLE